MMASAVIYTLAAGAGAFLGTIFLGGLVDAIRLYRDARASSRIGPCGSEGRLTFTALRGGGLQAAIVGAAGAVTVTLLEAQRAAVIRELTGVTDPLSRLAAGFVREEVAAFAVAMETRLRYFDPTKGWPPVFPFGLDGLARQLQDEAIELEGRARFSDAQEPDGRAKILQAAADLGNMAMLVGVYTGREAMLSKAGRS